MDETCGDIAIFSMPLDDCDFDNVALKIGFNAVWSHLQVKFETFGDDFARNDADCTRLAAIGLRPEV
ncbi:hypothetical protein D9M68_866490 [compost metagenome]